MPTIFICYRRADTSGQAGRLYDRLRDAFGDDVFMDVGDIPPGADFQRTIEERVRDYRALLVMIGDEWLAKSEDGTPRLHQPDDWVRREIASALNAGRVVMPVLVNGAALPSAKDLPAEIVALTHHQAVRLDDDRFDDGARRIVRALRSPRRSATTTAVVACAVVVALALVAYGGCVAFRGSTPGTSTSHDAGTPSPPDASAPVVLPLPSEAIVPTDAPLQGQWCVDPRGAESIRRRARRYTWLLDACKADQPTCAAHLTDASQQCTRVSALWCCGTRDPRSGWTEMYHCSMDRDACETNRRAKQQQLESAHDGAVQIYAECWRVTPPSGP